jgi:outer membrane immunogenic protein
MLGLCTLLLVAIPARAQTPAMTPSWTGFYVGLSAGARFADNTWTTTDIAPTLSNILTTDPNASASFDSWSTRLGGYAGYNWLIAPAWIAGVEADFGWAGNRKSRTPIPGTVQIDIPSGLPYTNQPTGTVEATWDASLRARIGKLIRPDVLIFATAGGALQQVELSATCPTSGGTTDWCTVPHDETYASTRLGWTIGGGVERVSGRWVTRFEYRYADFGTLNHTFFTFDTGVPYDDRFTANVDVRTHTATISIAYKLDGL